VVGIRGIFSGTRAARKKLHFGRIFHKFLCPSKDPTKKNVSEDPLTLNEEMYPHRSTKSFEFLRSHDFSHDFPVLDTQYIEWKTLGWKHKTQNSWILPALIKSCSKINSDDWDRTPATTNLGEAQHHWSNLNTALKTSLLEAVLL
jgi:hypothetical protein